MEPRRVRSDSPRLPGARGLRVLFAVLSLGIAGSASCDRDAAARGLAVRPKSIDLGDTSGSTTLEIWKAGGGEFTYALSVDYGAGPGGWLSLSATGGTSSGEHQFVTLTHDPAGLPPGEHAAAVVVTVDASTKTVPARTSVVGVATSVASHDFGSSIAPFTLQVWNEGAGTLDFQVQSQPSWLDVAGGTGSSGGPGDPQGVVLTVDPTGLAPSTYAGQVVVSPGTGQGTNLAAVDVFMTVPSPGTSVLSVAPAEGLTSSGAVGGPFSPPSKTYTLTNTGSDPLAWSAAANAAWIGLSSTGGQIQPGGQFAVTVSIAGSAASALPPASYSGTVSFTNLTSGAGNTQRDVTLAVGTTTVTIENNRWLLVNGQKFFPIGVWQQPHWLASYHKGLGINTFFIKGQGSGSDEQLLDTLQAEGMYGILHFNAAVQDHPALLMWGLPDEPDQAGTLPSVIQQEYDAIKLADPDHPVALNLTVGFYTDSNFYAPPSWMGGNLSYYDAYAAVPDVLSFDIYPVTGWNQPSWLYIPGAATHVLRTQYGQSLKPTWCFVEASDQNLSWTPPGTPGPTPAQLRFEVWDAVIRGATAIHYFTIAFNPFTWSSLPPAIEQEMLAVNTEITALKDVILSLEPPINVTGSEASGKPFDFMVRQAGTTYYLFVANAHMGLTSETLTFTFPQPLSSVAVWGTSQTLPASGNAFTDTLGPIGVRIYGITLQ